MNDNRGDRPTEKTSSILTRRRILQGAGGFIAAAAFPAKRAAASVLGPNQGPQGAPSAPVADLTGRLARYMVEARNRNQIGRAHV